MSTVKLELNAKELAIVCNALRRAKKYVASCVDETQDTVDNLRFECITLRANIEFLKEHEHEDHNNEDSTKRRGLIEDFESRYKAKMEFMKIKESQVPEYNDRYRTTDEVMVKATELMDYFDEEERFG